MARITGHALLNEGAAYDGSGQRIGSWIATSRGTGRGKCQCGALSNVLPSGTARRKWHRDVHKPQVATQQNKES